MVLDSQTPARARRPIQAHDLCPREQPCRRAYPPTQVDAPVNTMSKAPSRPYGNDLCARTKRRTNQYTAGQLSCLFIKGGFNELPTTSSDREIKYPKTETALENDDEAGRY